MPATETRLRVRYAETDQMGVVYHANYLIWMELGRVELCRATGVSYRDLEEQEGLRLAVVEASCRYLSPARYDDEVSVRTHVLEANPRLIRFGYEMSTGDPPRKLATGETKHLWLGPDLRPARLPSRYLALFAVGLTA